jgi:hypothetical protein
VVSCGFDMLLQIVGGVGRCWSPNVQRPNGQLVV